MLKINRKIIIIFLIFMFFIGNKNEVFAKTKRQNALESFKYYYSDSSYDCNYKSFIKSAEYKKMKKNNKNKSAEYLYVEYYLSNGNQAVKNFLEALSDNNLNMSDLSDKEYVDAVDMAIALYAHEGTLEKSLGYSGAQDFNKKMKKIKERSQKDSRYNKLTEKQKNDLNNGNKNTVQSAGISEGEGKTESSTAEEDTNEKIYNQPGIVSAGNASSTLDDMMTDADSFVANSKSDSIDSKSLQDFSSTIYNIALQIGIGVAVVAGLALGIQFMLAGVDGKADVKKALIAYVVGCVAIFGAFGIWKLVIEVMQQI